MSNQGDEPGRCEPRQPKSKKTKKERTQEKVASRNIRTVFSPVAKKRSTKPEKTVIILDLLFYRCFFNRWEYPDSRKQ